jgi:hypothetical protein
MSDPWTDVVVEPAIAEAARDPLKTAAMKELIERALQRELGARRELKPHVQLAVPRHATPDVLDAAYERLQRRYHPEAFAEYGAGAVAAATSIVELLRDAHRRLREPATAADENATERALTALESRPRGDETMRALESLRAAIQRRIAEAEHHRDAGRFDDAIRVFESVVILDRNNAIARQALAELREHREARGRTVLDRIFARVLGRP